MSDLLKRDNTGPAITVEHLEEHIRTLACLEESDAPVISCYLSVSEDTVDYRAIMEERIETLRSTFLEDAREAFQEAAGLIRRFLRSGMAMQTRGVAVFARGGLQPFFLPLQFQVPLPNTIVVDFTPKIYSLVELKDSYDRFVILLTTHSIARIIGVNLGALTEQVWTTRAEPCHHSTGADAIDQDHGESTRRFIREVILRFERFVSNGRYDHLILAGDLRAVADIRLALPANLAGKLVDIVPASPSDRAADLIRATLPSFLEHRQLDSQAITRRLMDVVGTHGFAVTGTCSSIRALKDGAAELLVLLKDFDPGLSWECIACGKVETGPVKPELCSGCRSASSREFEIREELIRLAGRIDCKVEVVGESDRLRALGGVGCLIRSVAPTMGIPRAA